MNGGIRTTHAVWGEKPNGFIASPDGTIIPNKITYFYAMTKTVTRDFASATIVKRAQR